MMTADGPALIDWDLLCWAPAGWDHGPMMTWHERWGGAAGEYDAFASGYGASLRDDPTTEAFAELRLVAATLMRLKAARRDPSARPEADRRLAYWRGDLDAPPGPPSSRTAQPVQRKRRMSFCLKPVYGGYISDGSGRVGLSSTGLAWEKMSKPALPWYAPMPLGPTPPNGRSGTARWSSTWFRVTPPDEVRSTILRERVVVGTERVERQRLVAIVDEPDRLVDVGRR